MESEYSSDKDRPYSPFFRLSSAAAIVILLFGEGWSSLSPSGAAGNGASEVELASLERSLQPLALGESSPSAAAASAEDLVRASRLAGIDPRETLTAAFPSPSEILGILSLDRDVDDFLEYADRKDAAGDYYRAEAKVCLELRPLRDRYEAIFATTHAALSGIVDAPPMELGGAGRKSPYIAAPEDVWLPPRSELARSHPYALDVFFQRVDRNGEAEKGPIIRSLYPGIVVAAAADWSGGQGITNWKSGGLSPAAGNGVVIYDPATRKYCSYFHLYAVALRTGDIVAAGTVVGRGGNTGMNARKAGHGEHVHIEIFDAARDASLTAYEIRDQLKK